jgi:hypothetical protein
MSEMSSIEENWNLTIEKLLGICDSAFSCERRYVSQVDVQLLQVIAASIIGK